MRSAKTRDVEFENRVAGLFRHQCGNTTIASIEQIMTFVNSGLTKLINRTSN